MCFSLSPCSLLAVSAAPLITARRLDRAFAASLISPFENGDSIMIVTAPEAAPGQKGASIVVSFCVLHRPSSTLYCAARVTRRSPLRFLPCAAPSSCSTLLEDSLSLSFSRSAREADEERVENSTRTHQYIVNDYFIYIYVFPAKRCEAWQEEDSGDFKSVAKKKSESSNRFNETWRGRRAIGLRQKF